MSEVAVTFPGLKKFRAPASPPQPVEILSRFEKMNLALPFVFLGIILASLVFNIHVGREETTALHLLRSYVFLDSTHVICTLFILFSLPEAKELLWQSLRHRRIWFYLAGALLIVGPVALYVRRNGLTGYGSWAVLAFPILAQAQHAIKQSYGMSRWYNRQAFQSLSPANIMRFKLNESYELFLFKAVIFLVILQRLHILLPAFIGVRAFQLVSLILVGPVVGILWLSLRDKNALLRHKQAYLFRLLICPLWGVSVIAINAFSALHGIEYILVALTMISRSRIQQKTFLIGLMLFSCALYTWPSMVAMEPAAASRIFGAHWFPGESTSNALFFVCGLIAYFHYFLDSLLFRVRDPLIRRSLGPLLGI